MKDRILIALCCLSIIPLLLLASPSCGWEPVPTDRYLATFAGTYDLLGYGFKEGPTQVDLIELESFNTPGIGIQDLPAVHKAEHPGLVELPEITPGWLKAKRSEAIAKAWEDHVAGEALRKKIEIDQLYMEIMNSPFGNTDTNNTEVTISIDDEQGIDGSPGEIHKWEVNGEISIKWPDNDELAKVMTSTVKAEVGTKTYSAVYRNTSEDWLVTDEDGNTSTHTAPFSDTYKVIGTDSGVFDVDTKLTIEVKLPPGIDASTPQEAKLEGHQKQDWTPFRWQQGDPIPYAMQQEILDKLRARGEEPSKELLQKFGR